jgi:hypothetical protein
METKANYALIGAFTLAVDLLTASCYELTHGDLARVMALRKLR